MEIKNYLMRMGIENGHEITNTEKSLAKLQYHHVTQIPFENLDIIQGIPLSLNTSKLYDKIVTRKRGGVCYELNGLFHSLLKELGFTIMMVGATVNSNGRWFIENTHATNIVHLNGIDYLIDVGFGASTPRQPIPLTGEVIQDTDASYYRVQRYPDDENRFILEKKETGQWKILYRFSRQEMSLDDFIEVCKMTQYSSQSVFNKKISVMIVTAQGRVMLKENSLTQVNGSNKTKIEIKSNQTKNVLEELFKLEYLTRDAS